MFSPESVCLSVCPSVCQHDNFRTIKRRTMKPGGYVHSTKNSREFECQGHRSKVMVTGNKKTKRCDILIGSGPRGAGLYAGVKISACCLVPNEH